MHDKAHNADNASQTNYCKNGAIRIFSVIIVAAKQEPKTIGPGLNKLAGAPLFWLEKKPISYYCPRYGYEGNEWRKRDR